MKKNSQSEKKATNIQSVERALGILEYLSKIQTPVGVAEIGDELGINRTTVYGLLNTLMASDYVVRSQIGGKYTISGKMYSLSYSYPNRLPVVRFATRYMQELADRYDVTAHLGTLSIRNDILLVNAQFPKNIQNIRSGSTFPLHASSMGKVILSYMPEEKREEMLENCDMRPYTRHTITDKDILRKEISVIRRQGYGRDVEEYLDGTSCVAFPIFNDKDEIVAAMSVSGTLEQINTQIDTMITDGLRCSKQCSAEMGWGVYNR